MKLQNQVCTFEQAKRLKELGIVQMSLFKTIDNNNNGIFISTHVNKNSEFSLFTLSELAVMIGEFSLNCYAESANSDNEGKTWYYVSEYDDTVPAHLLANFLISSLEKHYLTIDKCNQRLLNS